MGVERPATPAPLAVPNPSIFATMIALLLTVLASASATPTSTPLPAAAVPAASALVQDEVPDKREDVKEWTKTLKGHGKKRR